jgi:hypothetical protein
VPLPFIENSIEEISEYHSENYWEKNIAGDSHVRLSAQTWTAL